MSGAPLRGRGPLRSPTLPSAAASRSQPPAGGARSGCPRAGTSARARARSGGRRRARLELQLALGGALLLARRGHERVPGAALVVVDEVERRACRRPRRRTPRTAGARRSRRLERVADRVDADGEVLDVGVAEDHPAVAVCRRRGSRSSCRSPRRCRAAPSPCRTRSARSRRSRAAGRRSPPCRAVVMRCSVSSVTYAVVIANSRSGAGLLDLARGRRMRRRAPWAQLRRALRRPSEARRVPCSCDSSALERARCAARAAGGREDVQRATSWRRRGR